MPQRPFTKVLVFSEKTPVTTHRHGRNFGPGSLLFTRSAYPSQNVESARLPRTRATGGLAHPLRETRLDLQAKLSAEPRTRLSRCSFRSPRNFLRFENHASFSVMHSRVASKIRILRSWNSVG